MSLEIAETTVIRARVSGASLSGDVATFLCDSEIDIPVISLSRNR